MAEHIQGELVLKHIVETSKPTKKEKPTEAELIDDEDTGKESPKVDNESKDSKRVKGIINASVARRTANLVLKTGEGIINRNFDRRIYAQNFIGNSRGAGKIQNQKAQVNNVTSRVKAFSGAGVTALAIGGYAGVAIFGIQILDTIASSINESLNFKLQLEQYNMNRDKDIFSTRYGRDRLNYYNRRRG